MSAGILAIILLLSLPTAHCSRSNKAQPSLLGEYQYTGYDKGGNKIVEGRLSIESLASTQIKGNWQLNKIGNPEKLGPQVGKGTFAGEIIEDKVTINLNPEMADNNVSLTGRIDGGNFRGTWSFSGFAGEINRGTFEARRK
jgi:hypothetical protein